MKIEYFPESKTFSFYTISMQEFRAIREAMRIAQMEYVKEEELSPEISNLDAQLQDVTIGYI